MRNFGELTSNRRGQQACLPMAERRRQPRQWTLGSVFIVLALVWCAAELCRQWWAA